MTTYHPNGGHIDDDHREPSPSTGWRETAAIMHAGTGAEKCDRPECDQTGEPVQMIAPGPDTVDVLREEVQCSRHAEAFLEVKL